MNKRFFLMSLLLLLACSNGEEENPRQRLSAAEVLGSSDVEGFLRASEPRRFNFPQDHAAHPGFRNEWWYFTGNLETQNGRRFGYQVTFFSSAIRPDADDNCEVGNAWCTNAIWMGHAAISDISSETHMAAEIFSRQEPGLAGATLNPFRVWINDWQLFSADNEFPWELEVITDEFALSLNLMAEKSPVLQGANGLSQKTPEAGNASYYYSVTRIDTRGQVYLDDQRHEVNGTSWLDREWSTSALGADQTGWDWVSLQLDDGKELMYYQLRDTNGNAHPNSGGNLTSLMGTQSAITPQQMRLEEEIYWQAPDGKQYAIGWHMIFQENDWLIQAVFDDQLMDVTFQYWEGAVEVLDSSSGVLVGRGYLEMVR